MNNAELQKKALEEMQVESERDAIYKVKEYIKNIAQHQKDIEEHMQCIENIKKQLSEISIWDFSIPVSNPSL